MDDSLCRAQLGAFLHDPIEKALILMRTREGHERGTSLALRERLGIEPLPPDAARAVARADRWASAADRAVFPRETETEKWPAWQQVRFDRKPVIIHPLTGEAFDLGSLQEVEPEPVKELAMGHLEGLVHWRDEGRTEPCLRRTALAFWRFGPEVGDDTLGALWGQLPADSRVPDHTIFDHLDLVTALTTCHYLAPEQGPAHLVVSLGPVQAFIAAARTTSDLWAGSHLLSRISWEAMKVVCEHLGPQAIIFPRLRGIPLVDLWLRDEQGLRAELFQGEAWTRGQSDANPLFTPALPNRFTALVPADRVRDLAEEITGRVRDWVREEARATYRALLEEAGLADAPDLPGHAQIERQLDGFPEVQWAGVPWHLADTDGEGRITGTGRLREALAPFFESDPPGFLGSPVWEIMEQVLDRERRDFWPPNPGMLYPAWFELAERSLAAVKSLRAFPQTREEGWRDSLTGELEWLTTDRQQLTLPPGQRRDTLWARVQGRRPAWARKGEHLSAPGALKRLWPSRYTEELRGRLDLPFSRFAVSTHTMAIASSLARALEEKRPLTAPLRAELEALDGKGLARERLPLPRKLARALRSHPERELVRLIPGWLEALGEKDEEGRRDEMERRRAERLLEGWLDYPPERYYGLLLMDGDRMGAWLSADPGQVEKRHRDSFHPRVRTGVEEAAGSDTDPLLRAYADSRRAPTPAWHMAISEALNHFALALAPQTVEELHHGRILYAGGDDLLAMVPVAELLSAMGAARAAYSGIAPAEAGLDLDLGYEPQGSGFVLYQGRLLRLMGAGATASCGGVVAHHKTPLGAVLRELRAAEADAKRRGGRNAFSVRIIKRSGGALRLTAGWGPALRQLIRLRDFLAEKHVSRRAAYNVLSWLADMPEPDDAAGEEMLAHLLAYQLQRQCASKATRDWYDLPDLARALARTACEHAGVDGPPPSALRWLESFIATAEFLAREGRAGAGASAPAGHREQAVGEAQG